MGTNTKIYKNAREKSSRRGLTCTGRLSWTCLVLKTNDKNVCPATVWATGNLTRNESTMVPMLWLTLIRLLLQGIGVIVYHMILPK